LLEEIERGDITRLIITMPPRHGKSMTVTESFPSWFIGRNPERRVIEVSYGSELAQRFGLNNRRKIEEFGKDIFGIQVSSENASKTNWGLVGFSGGMISAGIGGSITGQGADLLIIDDPIKNRKEAESETYRNSIWSEWQDTLSSRLHPCGRVVVIMTRWHEDDLVGRLLVQDVSWRLINLPALAEEQDIIGREEGQPLWPEHGYDKKWAVQEKAMKGTRSWESLYQGHPRPSDGNLFRQSMFRRFKVSGTCYKVEDKIYDMSSCKIFQTCDVAGSKKTSADYFVLGTFALCPNGELLVLEVFRERLEGPDQPILIKRKYEEYKPVLIGVESANMGLTLYQLLRRMGLPVIELRPDTDKYTRAIPAAARYESGMVYHNDGSYWLNDLESELLAFPNGAHDDQVDVMSYAVYMQSWGYLKDKKRGGRALVLG
jgi:predicted phage terminase large subunit-like protein